MTYCYFLAKELRPGANPASFPPQSRGRISVLEYP